MIKDYFNKKSYCEFGIISDEVPPEAITKELNIQPTRFFCKGDKVISKHSSAVGQRPHNLWALKSPDIISENDDIKPHIQYFKSILENKIEILRRYKKDSRFTLSFWIWIETEDAGIGFDLLEEDILFINNISNRVSFSFITQDNIDNISN